MTSDQAKQKLEDFLRVCEERKHSPERMKEMVLCVMIEFGPVVAATLFVQLIEEILRLRTTTQEKSLSE